MPESPKKALDRLQLLLIISVVYEKPTNIAGTTYRFAEFFDGNADGYHIRILKGTGGWSFRSRKSRIGNRPNEQ